MLLSLALIILVGFALKGIFEKFHLPGLLGTILPTRTSMTIMAISLRSLETAIISVLMRFNTYGPSRIPASNHDLQDLKESDDRLF